MTTVHTQYVCHQDIKEIIAQHTLTEKKNFLKREVKSFWHDLSKKYSEDTLNIKSNEYEVTV